MTRLSSSLGLLLLAALLWYGCGATEPAERTGHVRLLLTEAPPGERLNARVTVERVELIREDGHAVLLAGTPRDISLQPLRGDASVLLAEAEVPPGTYREVRLVLARSATVIALDGTRREVNLSDGRHHLLTIRLPHFLVDEARDRVVALFDLDAAASFRIDENGDVFRPILEPVYLEVNGDRTLLQTMREAALGE